MPDERYDSESRVLFLYPFWHQYVYLCGPDVRWCGNEAGHTRESEWSVVPAFLRDIERGDSWQPLYRHTFVGYKRICRFPETTARRIRLTIEASRWCPTVSAFEVYLSPGR
ncbi:hypothetical protein [Cohnella sp. GbtcB17]|uniref:hypothetical protein n=1 Tax=Cohnella sp. GbtcB17 TaxID=2824762 RepID=UPI001C2F27E0|nr:hypothetical protein [Cohnella sp. GbtcB17]